MDQIENKIKVIRDSDAFKWAKNLTITVGNYVLKPENREDEINALIILACFEIAKTYGRDPQSLPTNELLFFSVKYLSTVMLFYCEYYLFKKDVTITPEITLKLKERIEAVKFNEKLDAILMKRLEGNMTPFECASSISAFSFGTDATPESVISLCADLVPFKPNVEEINELQPGMSVCGCTLVSLISKKEHSEIWKADYRGKQVAIKFEPLDIEGKELKNMIKGSTFEKIINHIKETDEEWKGYVKLKDFPYKLDYFKVDYYNPLNMKVKLMSWLDGPVSSNIIENKKIFLQNMVELLYELHKRGIVFNNIKPEHIMVKSPVGQKDTDLSNRLRLIDYKNVTLYKGEDKSPHDDDYRSLALLGGSMTLTPYDDIESLLYVFNTLINGKIIYVDLSDEILRKSQLSSFSFLVSDAITKLRLLKQNDIYVNSLDNPVDIAPYIDIIYKNGIRSTQTGEMMPGIVRIIMDIINNFKEVPGINVQLTKVDSARLNNIRNQFSQDPHFSHIINNPAKFNDITLKILNFITSSCEYEEEDQRIIVSFLNGN